MMCEIAINTVMLCDRSSQTVRTAKQFVCLAMSTSCKLEVDCNPHPLDLKHATSSCRSNKSCYPVSAYLGARSQLQNLKNILMVNRAYLYPSLLFITRSSSFIITSMSILNFIIIIMCILSSNAHTPIHI